MNDHLQSSGTARFECVEIFPGSAAYAESLVLRDNVLRKPIGLEFPEADLVKERQYRHFGLYRDGMLLACLMVVPAGAEPAKIRQMAVLPEMQGQGLGRDLMGAVEKILLESGVGELYLHARGHAVGFYEKLGYGLVGEPFTEVGIPHRRMEKRLRH